MLLRIGLPHSTPASRRDLFADARLKIGTSLKAAPVVRAGSGQHPHLNFGIAGTLMRGGGGAATPGALPTRLGLANILAAPICEPSAAFGRLPPIAAAPPPGPPAPRANEAAGVAKTMNSAIATFTFTEVFDMGKLH
jgi:hypothetical protein